MTRRTQWIVLGVLLAALAPIAYFFFQGFMPAGGAPRQAALTARFTPLNVDNPALRMDILKRFLALQYQGVHRNIFSATLPPPPAPAHPKQPLIATPIVPELPPAPPPLTVSAKYFGYVSDPVGSHRRAFFASSNGEDIMIAGEGDTIMGQFRVIRLTSAAADLEEVSSGRRATLNLEATSPIG
jgi:hypothetical protein